MNENIKAGADIHAGDGGYSEGTKEKYDEFVKIRNKSLSKSLCGCYYCTKERDVFETFSRMIVCPVCGNKRCPKATDHNYECTGSNEPGQNGSRYLI